MFLACLAILLFSWSANSANVGESCTASGGTRGTCLVIDDCPSVLDELVAGKSLDNICSHRGFDPVVCCPSQSAKKPMVNTARVEVLKSDGRGQIARTRCAEYAQYVYALVDPPALASHSGPVNISQCAIKSQKLIVGGTAAEPKEFPHMAAIGFNMGSAGIGWLCGGTLVSENFVLTAAHCTYSSDWGVAFRVRVGDLNLIRQDDRAQPQERNVVERIRHPKYKAPSQYNDIALLKLNARVTFNAWVRPACLHTAPATGTQSAIATGWGRVDWFEDDGSNDLLKVTLKIVDQPTCDKSYTSDTTDDKLQYGIDGTSMLCAGEVGKDTCQGDSGGPLVIYSSDQKCMYDVVGVTSFGRLCGNVNPGVYTRVYNYVPWVESVVWPRG